MKPVDPFTISRRSVLKAGAALSAAALAPTVFARNNRAVSVTLPWLAQGATAYMYVAEDQGFFKKRGIDINIVRGYGSLAAAQNIGNGQFDFGLVSASSTILTAANKVPLVALGTTNYDAYIGILVRADSSIRSPADLEGKKMGGVPAGAEFPLWKAFAANANVDPSKVDIIQADARVLERALVEKQVDAIMCVASSSYAVMQGMNAKCRALLLADHGISFYSNNIVTRPETLSKEPRLCQDMTDAILEGLAFAANDPSAAMGILLKKVPELALSSGGKENVRLSQGFMLASLAAPESIAHGLGYSDFSRLEAMTDTIMKYVAPSTAIRPNMESLFTNEFVGRVKLNDAQWAKVKEQNAEFPKLLLG